MVTVFKISDNLELKLNNGKTNIYVNGKRFRQCKYLLLNIPVDEIPDYDDIGSIDEVKQYLDDSLEKEEINRLKPEVEFFGHCSNLQAWYENGYDTCILHSNLSFPLLRELGEYDSRAKVRFDEELVNRLNTGYEPVQEYLFNEYSGYILRLPEEKADSIESDKIKIKKLNLSRNKNLNKLPKWIGELRNLQKLNLGYNNLRELPESIGGLRNLQALYLSGNKLRELPESIGKLTNLQELYLADNNLLVLPESIGNLKNLKTIYLSSNELRELPESIDGLRNLQRLNLSYNNLRELPESIGGLRNLQVLYLRINKLNILPESIGELRNLQVLYLRGNKLRGLPESINELRMKLPECNIYY